MGMRRSRSPFTCLLDALDAFAQPIPQPRGRFVLRAISRSAIAPRRRAADDLIRGERARRQAPFVTYAVDLRLDPNRGAPAARTGRRCPFGPYILCAVSVSRSAFNLFMSTLPRRLARRRRSSSRPPRGRSR